MATPKHLFRKQVLVQPRMQIDVALSMVASLTAFTAMYVVSIMAVQGPEPVHSSETTRGLAYLVTGIYFVLAACGTLLVGLRATHRIAGPAMVIERVVRGLREGDYEQRITLRKGDHLNSLADEVEALREELVTERNRRAASTLSMERALHEQDLELVRTLAEDLCADLAQQGDRTQRSTATGTEASSHA